MTHFSEIKADAIAQRRNKSVCQLIAPTLTILLVLSEVFSTRSNAADNARDDSGLTDLTKAVVIAPENLSSREKKAVSMLVDEVRKRTMVTWRQRSDLPKPLETPMILVGPRAKIRPLLESIEKVAAPTVESERSEGYQIVSVPKRQLIAGIGNVGSNRGVKIFAILIS